MFQSRNVATAVVPMIAQPNTSDRSRTNAVIRAERSGNAVGREAISTDRRMARMIGPTTATAAQSRSVRSGRPAPPSSRATTKPATNAMAAATTSAKNRRHAPAQAGIRLSHR